MDQPPRTYMAEHPFADRLFVCPVLGCEGEALTKFGLRRHFAYLHPQDYVDIPGESCYAKCGRCGMQVNPRFPGHRETITCETMKQVRELRSTVASASKALNVRFNAYGVEL